MSAVLLYDKVTQFDAERVLGPVHAWIAAVGDKLHSPDTFEDEEGARNIVAQGDLLHVHVREVAERAPAAWLEPSLANPLVDVLFPTARAIVFGHGAHSVLTVGEGVFGEVDEKPEDPLTLGPDRMLPNLRVLKKLSAGCIQHTFPLATLWTQSGVFRGGADFAQFALGHSDGPNSEVELFVDVLPYRVEREDGGTLYGVVTNGATAMIGREVELEAAAVPLDWALDRVLQFVASVVDAPGAQREGFRMAADEFMIVREAGADDRFPLGRIVLTVEKTPGAVNEEAPALTPPPLDAHASLVQTVANDPRSRAGFGRRA